MIKRDYPDTLPASRSRPLPFRLVAITPYESGVTVNDYVRSGSTP